jgi:predicted HNH restriction endonuclease
MNYWVVKGGFRNNDWRQLVAGGSWIWWTSKLADKLQRGDRAFFWQSYPAVRIVGLAEVKDPCVQQHGNGRTYYSLRCLTGHLDFCPTILQLRLNKKLSDASFLKAGASSCIFPLLQIQGEELFRLLAKNNTGLENIWPEIARSGGSEECVTPDLDLLESEGGLRFVQHLRRERNAKLVRAKKVQVLQQTGRLACECCGFDFAEFYGELGREFCEVHHKHALGASKHSRQTQLTDLAVICSNCHRIIHRSKPMPSLSRLAKLLIARNRLEP